MVDEKLDKVCDFFYGFFFFLFDLGKKKSAAALFGALGGASSSSSTRSAPNAVWCSVSVNKSDLPCLLLGLECRLGQAKRCHVWCEFALLLLMCGFLSRMTVGVLTAKAGQNDEQMFSNPASESLSKLMNILASRVPAKGWTGYTGGQTDPSRHIYYTSWRGFEIVFHVAVRQKKKGFLLCFFDGAGAG